MYCYVKFFETPCYLNLKIYVGKFQGCRPLCMNPEYELSIFLL